MCLREEGEPKTKNKNTSPTNKKPEKKNLQPCRVNKLMTISNNIHVVSYTRYYNQRSTPVTKKARSKVWRSKLPPPAPLPPSLPSPPPSLPLPKHKTKSFRTENPAVLGGWGGGGRDGTGRDGTHLGGISRAAGDEAGRFRLGQQLLRLVLP